jgi:hypothetical protein
VNKAIGAEFETYDEQQEIWRILQSAGYKPRFLETAPAPGLSNENWTISCMNDDFKDMLDDALMDLASAYRTKMSRLSPEGDDFRELEYRLQLLDRARDDLEEIPECL